MSTAQAEISKPFRVRREYSDREKKEALLLLGSNQGNLSKTANSLGIPLATLHRWAHLNQGVNADILSEVGSLKRPIADKLEEIAHKAANLIPGRLKKATTRELIGAIHIMVPAFQLLRGQPTDITANQADPGQLLSALIREKLQESLSPEQIQRIIAVWMSPQKVIDVTPEKPRTLENKEVSGEVVAVE